MLVAHTQGMHSPHAIELAQMQKYGTSCEEADRQHLLISNTSSFHSPSQTSLSMHKLLVGEQSAESE